VYVRLPKCGISAHVPTSSVSQGHVEIIHHAALVDVQKAADWWPGASRWATTALSAERDTACRADSQA